MPNVPLIVGTNRTEMTLFLAGDKTAFELDEAGLTKRAQKWFRDQADTLLNVYRCSLPDATPSEIFFLMISDFMYCVPLMEIVGEPDLRSPEQARDYLIAMRQILRYIGASTGLLERGAATLTQGPAPTNRVAAPGTGGRGVRRDPERVRTA